MLLPIVILEAVEPSKQLLDVILKRKELLDYRMTIGHTSLNEQPQEREQNEVQEQCC